MKKKPTVVSLYSGAGGLDYGFEKAGFETILANDNDPWAVETYGRLVRPDIAVNSDVDELGLPSPSDVDVVIGGPPCQGFSVAGKMNPDDPRSGHVWKFLEVVAKLRPNAFVMENVKALAVNTRWKETRHRMCELARTLGYNTRLVVLQSARYGVPQSRERMFLIGYLEGNPEIPQAILRQGIPSRTVLETLPPYGSPGNSLFSRAKITLASKPVVRKSCFAGMLFNGAGRPINLDGICQTLPASMGGNRTPIVDQRWLDRGNPDHWVRKYHRHLSSGGTPWPPDEAPSYLRRLTANEAAALQTFPRTLEWAGPTNSIFRQIGNAVPPHLAYMIALAVRKQVNWSRDIKKNSVAEYREASIGAIAEVA